MKRGYKHQDHLCSFAALCINQLWGKSNKNKKIDSWSKYFPSWEKKTGQKQAQQKTSEIILAEIQEGESFYISMFGYTSPKSKWYPPQQGKSKSICWSL